MGSLHAERSVQRERRESSTLVRDRGVDGGGSHGADSAALRSTDFPKMKFNQFLMAPYFGPGLLPHAQKLWIDELAVGTKRIGPLGAVK